MTVSESALPESRIKNNWTLALCAAMLMLFATLSFSASLTKNATYDEPLHAVSGFVIRDFGDYRIDPEDPAFFTWLSSIPHAGAALAFDRDDSNFKNCFRTHDMQWVSAINTLYRTPRNNPDAYIDISRFLFMLIGLATGAVVCWWAWKLAGRIGAFAATAAYALDPNFLGHASLVKNDVPLALITIGLMFALWRFGQRGTKKNLIAIIACCCFAMNIKFSGPIFFVITFIVLRLRAAMSQNWTVLKWDLKDRAQRWVVPYLVCAAAGLCTFVFTWFCYGFRYAPTPDPNLHFDFYAIVQRYQANMMQIVHQNEEKPNYTLKEEANIHIPVVIGAVRLLEDYKVLPEAWLHGFFYTYATTVMRGSYLNGQTSLTGWWYFFPLCVLYKTPVGTLAMLGLSLITVLALWVRRGLGKSEWLIVISLLMLLVRVILWACGIHFAEWGNWVWNLAMLAPIVVRVIPVVIRNDTSSDPWLLVCLITPMVLYGGSAMSSNFNLGIRHVLPLLPLMYVALGVAAARLVLRWRNLGALVVGFLGVSLAIESCSAWPDYIAFFNFPSGGERGGIGKLSDSNLDWGQDLILLADWHKAHPEKNIYLCYFGMPDPTYYDITPRIDLPGGYVLAKGQPLPNIPGIIAISATDLQGTYMNPQLRNFYKPLWSMEPRDVLGGTIYLYDWPLRPPTTQQ